MEYNHLEQPLEIVLTYRPEEPVEPVELRYERELPEGMRPAAASQSDPFQDGEAASWRSAIAPPEKAKKGRWGVRLFVTVSLLVALVCLGVGIWYVQQNSRGFPGDRGDQERPGGDQPAGEDDYYWDYGDVSDEEPTIDTYRPYGGSAIKLELVSAGEEAVPLTAGEVYEKVLPSTVTVM